MSDKPIAILILRFLLLGSILIVGETASAASLTGEIFDYAIKVIGDEITNECPEIMRIIPGPCPSGTSGGGNSLPASIPKTSAGLRTTSIPETGFFTSNETVSQRDLANLYDRELARAEAYDLLGERGTDWLEANILLTTEIIERDKLLAEQIDTLTVDAQDMDVTQDVMKQAIQVENFRARMSLEQVKLQAMMQASLLSIQVQQANLMQLNANLSEALDEANRRERLELDATYLESDRLLIQIPGMVW